MDISDKEHPVIMKFSNLLANSNTDGRLPEGNDINGTRGNDINIL